MRFSLVLCGATAVTALSVPDNVKRQGVDLGIFDVHKFPLLDPAKAAADAGKNNAQFNPAMVPSPAEEAPKVARPPTVGNMRFTSSAAATCSNSAVRLEWRNLSDAHKVAFVNAIKCLQGKPAKTKLQAVKNRLDDMTAIHQKYSATIHNVGQFLPWHRYYLHVFETLLRNECGYTGPMTWWDETKDAGHFNKAPMLNNNYFGNAPLKTSSGQGTCIVSGKFANTQLPIGPGQGHSSHCLSRAVDESQSAVVSSSFVSDCNSHANYTDMWKCSFTGPHAWGHNAMGAVMSDVDSSPGDPIFFLHHGFIDRNWRIWQRANKNSRLYQINGYTTQTAPFRQTTLDTVLPSNGILPDAKVRDVMDTEGGYLCYKYDY